MLLNPDLWYTERQSMNPQLIKYFRKTGLLYYTGSLARKKNRRRLFNVYPTRTHARQSVDHNIDSYKNQFSYRIFVKCEA